MLNNIKGSSEEKNKKLSLKQKEQLKNVCIAKATAFPRNCASLPLLFPEELFGAFPLQFLLGNTFTVDQNSNLT